MKEQLISFETAKLAKEKGFNYIEPNCFGDNMCYELPEGELKCAHEGNTVAGYILVPTQSLLQKWLREFHNIHIIIILVDGSYGWCIQLTNKNEPILCSEPNTKYETFENALEIALQESLKIIR